MIILNGSAMDYVYGDLQLKNPAFDRRRPVERYFIHLFFLIVNRIF